MFEFIIALVLMILTAIVGVFLFDALMKKSSLERSHELFWKSIVFFPIGIILSALWYLLSISSVSNSTEYLGLSGGAFLEAILFLFAGLRHERKYREYTRVNLEIVGGLSGTVPDE